MAKSEKTSVKYSDVKPTDGDRVNIPKYMRFLKIYHTLRPYLQKENKITKVEFSKLFPKDKLMAGEVWVCVFELKLIWAKEIFDRLEIL